MLFGFVGGDGLLRLVADVGHVDVRRDRAVTWVAGRTTNARIDTRMARRRIGMSLLTLRPSACTI
jgi:hypothetical protein